MGARLMNKSLYLISLIILAISGCADTIPYRTEGFRDMPECKALYEQYSDDRKVTFSETSVENQCWKRSKEERDRYDLLFVEFDDQGWVQNTSNLKRPAEDYLDAFFKQLHQLYLKYSDHGLSLVLYVHGWHHNAQANDENVREFRALLRDIALAEGNEEGRRVIGIYVGWRGDSITVPGMNALTFWDRKNTAERVSQGSVREFFSRLDVFRDRASGDDRSRKVRLLTIGHSFGGLITYESLSSEFLRAAGRRNGERSYLSRLGDLVVIVNPAFEGTRYEPLKIAGQRLKELRPDQLPVVIVATTKADWATGWVFPIARRFSTFFEKDPDNERAANIQTVGHNDLYTTHQLSICDQKDEACWNACARSGVLSKSVVNIQQRRAHIVDKELARMKILATQGFKTKEYLCGGLMLTATEQWQPPANPFWVVQTSGDVMDSHGDIFNPNFVAFIRQMYLAVIVGTDRSRHAPQ